MKGTTRASGDSAGTGQRTTDRSTRYAPLRRSRPPPRPVDLLGLFSLMPALPPALPTFVVTLGLSAVLPVGNLRLDPTHRAAPERNRFRKGPLGHALIDRRSR